MCTASAANDHVRILGNARVFGRGGRLTETERGAIDTRLIQKPRDLDVKATITSLAVTATLPQLV